MTYKHDHDKHDYYKDAFYFKGNQAVDQANDANVGQSASVEQVALVDQELNQAVVQNSEQNNAIVIEGGDGGAGGAGGVGGAGGGGNGANLDVIEAILGSGLPPGIIRQILEDLILIGDGAGGAGGAGGDIGDVTAANVNNQFGFNIGANVSDVDQDLDADFDQDQDVGIGQVNLASLDVF